jgi:DNA-binding SARP family transcriptional activator
MGSRAGIELRLLEGFELLLDGGAQSQPLSVQRLLAFLALHDRPPRRVYVAGQLWPETTEARAFANLRSTLWRAHRCGQQVVDTDSSHLRLSADVEVDVRRAAADARRVVDGSAERGELAHRSFAMLSQLLPDWYDDWVIVERERYRQLGLHALEALADRLTAMGRAGEAADAAVAAIAGDPLRESAHRSLIRVHLSECNSSEALRQYHHYRAMISEQLGLAPSDAMELLVRGLEPG